MHIDVRIKANQAGRHHPYHPPTALPPTQLPLCSTGSSMRSRPAQLTDPQTRNNDLGSLSKFDSPPTIPFHPAYIDRFQLYSVECSYSGTYWFQNQCKTRWSRAVAGCRLTNFVLNTNGDCFGRLLCDAIPYVPAECAVTYLLHFSRSHRTPRPPYTHTHLCLPLFLK